MDGKRVFSRAPWNYPNFSSESPIYVLLDYDLTNFLPGESDENYRDGYE